MNSVQILGTITRDIELKHTQSGMAIASFGIAYNEKRKQQDGSYGDVAHFFDLTAFAKTAENINQYFRKGSRILVQGSLDFQSWDDQQGQKRSKVGIKVERFDFIDRKDDNQQPVQQKQPYQAPQPQYQNAQGQQVTPQQYQAHQRAQAPHAMGISNEAPHY